MFRGWAALLAFWILVLTMDSMEVKEMVLFAVKVTVTPAVISAPDKPVT